MGLGCRGHENLIDSRATCQDAFAAVAHHDADAGLRVLAAHRHQRGREEQRITNMLQLDEEQTHNPISPTLACSPKVDCLPWPRCCQSSEFSFAPGSNAPSLSRPVCEVISPAKSSTLAVMKPILNHS